MWQRGVFLDRVQMQPLVMPAPRGTDLLFLFQDDEIEARFAQARTDRKSRGTRADDDDVSSFRHSSVSAAPTEM
jgi:hypothetical protein